jgi:galactose mutarotase-like enzyme
MPGAAAGEPELPDHDELWALPWEHTVAEVGTETVLTGTVEGRLLPYDLTREVAVPRAGAEIRLRYTLRHRGTAAFPFVWAAHPLLNVQAGTRVALPGVTQARVLSVTGRDDLAVGAEVAWPLDGGAGDWAFPGSAGWAVMLGTDLGADGAIHVTDPVRGERLELRARGVPQVGLWINAGGWAPARLAAGPAPAPYVNLGVEPAIGAPDRLDRAVGRWHTAGALAPGEVRRWELEVRLPEPGEH